MTLTRVPLAPLKWVAVGLAVPVMLVVAPIVDVVVGALGQLRRLLTGPAGRGRR